MIDNNNIMNRNHKMNTTKKSPMEERVKHTIKTFERMGKNLTKLQIIGSVDPKDAAWIVDRLHNSKHPSSKALLELFLL